MTTIDKLRELAERAPDICREVDAPVYTYAIGDYMFLTTRDGFTARLGSVCVTGRPALDWLQGALQTAIAARGWFWETSNWSYNGKPRHKVYISNTRVSVVDESTPAEALLSALLASLNE